MVILASKGLSKDFGGLEALRDLDLEVERGEIHGLIGPNGSGKTTAINLITGFLRPTSGVVMFKGRPIPHKADPAAIVRLGIGRTFQVTNLFDGVLVDENVIWARYLKTSSRLWDSLLFTRSYREERREQELKARELLDSVGLGGKGHLVASTLSHGQQRRLEIAIALAVEPEMLLLDEPAAGLHTEERLRLMKLIRQLQKRGVTILIVEHNMKVIMGICDRVTCLNFGSKLAEGTPPGSNPERASH